MDRDNRVGFDGGESRAAESNMGKTGATIIEQHFKKKTLCKLSSAK